MLIRFMIGLVYCCDLLVQLMILLKVFALFIVMFSWFVCLFVECGWFGYVYCFMICNSVVIFSDCMVFVCSLGCLFNALCSLIVFVCWFCGYVACLYLLFVLVVCEGTVWYVCLWWLFWWLLFCGWLLLEFVISVDWFSFDCAFMFWFAVMIGFDDVDSGNSVVYLISFVLYTLLFFGFGLMISF